LIRLRGTNQGARYFSKERPGRHSRELNDCSRHVRLVGVTRGERDVIERRPSVGLRQGEELLKANDPLECLGAVANRRHEPPMQLPPADAEVSGELARTGRVIGPTTTGCAWSNHTMSEHPSGSTRC